MYLGFVTIGLLAVPPASPVFICNQIQIHTYIHVKYFYFISKYCEEIKVIIMHRCYKKLSKLIQN